MARQAFAVNEVVRERVRHLAGVGVRQDDIARIIGCAPKTLRKRLRDELDRGVVEANATIAGYLFAAAKAGNIAAIIFWLKTRAHWRERLLSGNWKIRPAAGLYFRREWCAVVDQAPADLDIVRYWDLAATEKTELNDPDWTVGIKLGRDRNSGYWLLDVLRVRANPGDVERLLFNTVTHDGKRVVVGFGQDPGQAGKSQAQHLVRALSAFTVRPAAESGDKLTRFGPFSSQCRAGNVKILRGLWNEDLFRVLEGFPDLAHDDEVDACSGALEMLNPNMKGYGIYEFYRQKAEELQAERQATSGRPEPTYAPGSMEWLAQQKKPG